MKIILQKIDQGVEKIAEYGLYVCVVGMIIFSVLTIVFRWVNYNILWFEPLVRHLVFLAAFLGGVLATGRHTHIGIDILGKFFENKKMYDAQKWVERVISLACTLTLIWLIKASYNFMVIEFEYGKEEFLGIHSGFLVGIIPFGFLMIAIRFGFIFIDSFLKEEAK
ncbi:MAG: TRAP transporter small permease [Bacteriovoracaceae bacterium]